MVAPLPRCAAANGRHGSRVRRQAKRAEQPRGCALRRLLGLGAGPALARRWAESNRHRYARMQAEVVCVDWWSDPLELEHAPAWARLACDLIVGVDVLADRSHAACMASIVRAFLKESPADSAGCGLFVHSVRTHAPGQSPGKDVVPLFSDELARRGLAACDVTVDACGCPTHCHGSGAEGCSKHAVVVTLAHHRGASSQVLHNLKRSLLP